MNKYLKFAFTHAIIGLLLVGGLVGASTITTIQSTDTISDSRSTINTNFSNLNNGKLEISATTSFPNLSTVGTITTGTWNGDVITNSYLASSTEFIGVQDLTGTANQVNISSATGSVTLSLPQDIDTGASVTFATTTITNSFNLGGTVSATDNLTMEDTAYIGLGGSAGRLVFNDEATDNITLSNGNFIVSSLTSCDTIDTDASGVLSCGSDDDTTYTAGNALTLTGTDFDFDGGTSPSGELGGTWASITVDNNITIDSTGNVSSTAITGNVDISSQTNLSGGRSLTMNGDAVDADSELYTDSMGFTLQNATTSGNPQGSQEIPTAMTLTRFWCKTSGVDVTIGADESASDIFNGGSITCTSAGNSTTTFADSSLAQNNILNIDIDSVANSTTTVSGTFRYTRDD